MLSCLKRKRKKEKVDDGQAFVGQSEAKAAAFETFKFAADHDPKDDYISKTDYVQHKDHISVKEEAPAPPTKKEEAKKLDQNQISQEKQKRQEAKN